MSVAVQAARIAGLDEDDDVPTKDATFITFGRTLYREHRVSSELWQKTICVTHARACRQSIPKYFRYVASRK